MKTSLMAGLKRTVSWRSIKRISIVSIMAVDLTVFVLACSAPQDTNAPASGEQQSATDWKPVEQALGKAGSMQPGDVYKVSLPRSDLKVTVSTQSFEAPRLA